MDKNKGETINSIIVMDDMLEYPLKTNGKFTPDGEVLFFTKEQARIVAKMLTSLTRITFKSKTIL